MSIARVSTFAALVAVSGTACGVFAGPPVTIINGFAFQSWDPATEVAGRSNWHPESQSASWFNGLAWNWQENTLPDGTGDVVPPVVVPIFDCSVPGIGAAYQFPAARALSNGTSWENNATAGESMTLELWFKPSDLDGTHVLWEIGAANKGAALALVDDELVFAAAANDGAGGNTYVYEHRELLTDTDWHQAVIVTSYNDFTVTSYFDGMPVNTMAIAPSISYRWTGSNPTGLGTVGGDPLFPTATIAGGTIPVENFTDYDGMISIHRFYDLDLLSDEVLDNYNAIADAGAAARRGDFNLDGLTDASDKLDLVTFASSADTTPVPSVAFPFPTNPIGGVQMNDPANDQTFDADFVWNRDDGFNPTGSQEPSFQFANINTLMPVAVLDPAIPSVRRAFVLDGVEAFRGPKFEQADDSSAVRVQFWLDVADTIGNHCLFEAGGASVGFSVVTRGDEIGAAINTSANDGLDEVEITSGPGVLTTGWHLFEIVIRRFAGNGVGQGFELYMDGVQVAALNDEAGPDMEFGTADDVNVFSPAGAGNSNFIGGNQSGYGQVQGTAPLPFGFANGDLTPFNGLAGPFRLSQAQPLPADILAEFTADQGQDVINARNDLNGDQSADFFDTIDALKMIDAGS